MDDAIYRKAMSDICRAHLLALGDTSEAVAATLKEKGIKGSWRRADECPIAQYFKPLCHNEYVGATHAFVRIGFYEIRAPNVKALTTSRQVPMLFEAPNNAIFDFIYDFDNGKYPELVKEKPLND